MSLLSLPMIVMPLTKVDLVLVAVCLVCLSDTKDGIWRTLRHLREDGGGSDALGANNRLGDGAAQCAARDGGKHCGVYEAMRRETRRIGKRRDEGRIVLMPNMGCSMA